MSIFVSPFNPVQQAGVRAKNPPDLVVAARAPTTKDFGYFPGQLWLFINNSYWGMLNNYVGGVPSGVWVLFGAGGSPLTNINGIAPIAGQINLVANQTVPGIPDGIVITPPSTQGPLNTIGFGVLVDGVTVTLNGLGQLVASGAAATVQQFTVDSGGTNPVAPVGNNMNLMGNQAGHRGAIDFAGGPAGQIYARVLPDNASIDINATTGLLEVKGTFSPVQFVSAAGAAPQIGVSAVLPAALVPNSSSVTFECVIVGREVAAPFRSTYARFISGYRVNGAGAVAFPPGSPDVFVQTELTAVPDFTLISGGANQVQFQVQDNSGLGPINWKIYIDTVILP